MKPYLMGLFFRALSKFDRDPSKRRALTQMADEMAMLSRYHRGRRIATSVK